MKTCREAMTTDADENTKSELNSSGQLRPPKPQIKSTTIDTPSRKNVAGDKAREG